MASDRTKANSQSRLVVIGDSLAMPRLEDGIRYEDTYSYILGAELKGMEVICRAKRGNDAIKQSQHQSLYDDLDVFSPDLLVVNLGIVDCAPRLFSKLQSLILSKLPSFIRNKIISYCSNNRFTLTRIFPKVYVDQKSFRVGVESIFARAKSLNCRTLCVSIASTSMDNEKKSFRFRENISAYNEILRDLSIKYDVYYLDFHSASLDGRYLLSDGIHINRDAHLYIARNINNWVGSLAI